MSYLEKVVLNQLKTVTKLSLTFGQDTADRTAKADRRSQVECAQHLRNCNEQGAIERAECGVSDGAWSWEGQYMTGEESGLRLASEELLGLQEMGQPRSSLRRFLHRTPHY